MRLNGATRRRPKQPPRWLREHSRVNINASSWCRSMSKQGKTIGDITVTPLSDGVLSAPLDVVLGMDKAEVERMAGRKDILPISVNAFLLRLNGKWALIDTGSGNTMGPTLGKLPDDLRAHGIAPEEIATIFLTHLHPDHSNGLIDDAGAAIYPNAEVILHEN